MPHDIAENTGISFSVPVSVPDPGDARTAASVNVAFQTLTDRTVRLHDDGDDNEDRVDALAANLRTLSIMAAINWSDSKHAPSARLRPQRPFDTASSASNNPRRQMVSDGTTLFVQGDSAVSDDEANKAARLIDSDQWLQCEDNGLPFSYSLDIVAGYIGSTSYLIAVNDRTTGSGLMAPRKSNDGGITWASMGSLTLPDTDPMVLGYRSLGPQLFVLAGENKIYTSAGSTWTSRTVPAGWTTDAPVKIVCNPDTGTMIMAPSSVGGAGSGKMALSSNGTSWSTSAALPLATAGTRTLIGLCYSRSLARWCATSLSGDIWTSDDDGATWEQRQDKGSAAHPFQRQIAALGSVFVACAEDAGLLWWSGIGTEPWQYLAEVDRSEDDPTGASFGQWEDICVHQDRLVISRAYVPESSPSTQALAYRFSNRLPLGFDVEHTT